MQACTGIEDLGMAILHLEEANWVLVVSIAPSNLHIRFSKVLLTTSLLTGRGEQSPAPAGDRRRSGPDPGGGSSPGPNTGHVQPRHSGPPASPSALPATDDQPGGQSGPSRHLRLPRSSRRQHRLRLHASGRFHPEQDVGAERGVPRPDDPLEGAGPRDGLHREDSAAGEDWSVAVPAGAQRMERERSVPSH